MERYKALKEVKPIIEGELHELTPETLEGIAFNLGYESVGHMMNDFYNPKRLPRKSTSVRRLEKKLEENGGDKTWALLHK